MSGSNPLSLTLGYKKEIQISSSSVLNLKSELLLKSKAVKKQSVALNPSKLSLGKHKIEKPYRKNKGVVERSQRDVTVAAPHALEQSYIGLHRKAMIYQELQDRGIGMDEDEEVEELTKEFSDLVETIDDFGRTVLMKRAEYEQTHSKSDRDDSDNEESRIRVKEGEEQPATLHFQSNREKRTLGTGYYQFSQEDETRADQMAGLNELRENTIRNRNITENRHTIRLQKLEERRDMIRQRNMRNQGSRIDRLFEEIKSELTDVGGSEEL